MTVECEFYIFRKWTRYLCIMWLYQCDILQVKLPKITHGCKKHEKSVIVVSGSFIVCAVYLTL